MKFLLFFTIFIIFIVASIPSIYSASTQSLRGNIDDNFNAYINITFPFKPKDYGSFNIILPTKVGSMLIDYKLLGFYSENGELKKLSKNGEEIIITLDDRRAEDIFASFKVPAAFNTPTFVGFDFTIYTDEFHFKSPNLEIDYPDSLELLSSNPSYSQKKPLKIDYPENNNFGLIGLNFIKSPLPEGFVIKSEGLFKIVGTQEEVDKISLALANLTFLPEMYKRMTGEFSFTEIWVLVADLKSKGSHYDDVGGIARYPNIVLIDYENINNISKIALQGDIVHEISHLVIYQNIPMGQQWLHEGMAVFFELYSGDNYFNTLGYWLDEDSQGQNTLSQITGRRFTTDELKERYNQDFNFIFDNKNYGDDYIHSGLVFYNFYLIVGDAGLKRFFSELELMNFSVDCPDCDNQKILTIMESISGKSQEELLFPYKDDPEFESKVAKLVRIDMSQSEIDSILNQYNRDQIGAGSLFLGYLILSILAISIILIIIWIYKKVRTSKSKKVKKNYS